MTRERAGAKLRVGVVFGGRSGEHEVSLASAASVMAAMDGARFEVVPIGITGEGRWLVGGDPMRALTEAAAQRALTEGGAESDVKRGLAARASSAAGSASLARAQTSESLPPRLRQELDAVIVMLHGPRGEDGTIQGLLELADIPYVGARRARLRHRHGQGGHEGHVPGPRAAGGRLPGGGPPRLGAASGDGAGRGRPPHRLPLLREARQSRLERGHQQGQVAGGLAAASTRRRRHDRRLLVERAVVAREVEVAVLGNDAPEASLPGEVRFAGEWYDYETKYAEGQTTFQIPAPLSPETTARVRELAVRAFQAIDCAGMARVDFFIEGDDHILVNEINTIPGFTATSAYPRLWEATGLPYPALIARLVELALERR